MKMYWWRGGPRSGNFGDQLSPLLCEHLGGGKAVHVPIRQADLLGIGSVLEHHFFGGSARDFRGTIWGSGRMFGEDRIDLSNARIRALRGELTRDSIDHPRKADIALGDPGLLSHLLAPKTAKTIKLGVIPHWTEWDQAIYRQELFRSSEVRVIDICSGPMAVIEAVSRCHFVISTALHGLVVADALRVPNRWLRLNTGREYGGGFPKFKFIDYYSVFGIRVPRYMTLRPTDSIDSIIRRIDDYDRPGLSDIQAALEASYPFDIGSQAVYRSTAPSLPSRASTSVGTRGD